MDSATTVRRMWKGGPLRQWAAEPHDHFLSIDPAGYAGRYVCDVCNRPVVGVYKTKDLGWVCAACRSLSHRKPFVKRKVKNDQ